MMFLGLVTIVASSCLFRLINMALYEVSGRVSDLKEVQDQ